MQKFLRKYQKYILAVGGSLLMIAFLLPSAITRGGFGGGDRAVARMDGRKVMASELLEAERERHAALAPDGFGALLSVFPQIARIEKPEHWYMLTELAKRTGFVATAAQVDAFVNMAAQEHMQAGFRQIERLPQDRIQEAINQLQQIPTQVQQMRSMMSGKAPGLSEKSLAGAASIFQLTEAYLGATRASEQRALRVASRQQDRADVDLVAIRADSLLDKVPEPDEAALLAHFEQYKARARGQGEADFGYLQPASIKIETISLPAAAVAAAVKLDPVEVRKRWQSARDRFPGEFADERAKVESELRSEATQAALREAEQIIRGEAAQDAKRYADDGRWKRIPENWSESARPLQDVANAAAERLAQRLGQRIEPPVSRRDDWASANDLAIMPGIGASRIAVGARLAAFPQIIPDVREIGGREARGFQVGLINGPAADGQGNLYFFRITAARVEGPPSSLDAVRPAVARDLRRLRAFEMLEARRDELAASVREKGFAALAAEFPGAVPVAASVSRERAFVAYQPLDTPALRDAVMAAADALDPTRPVADAPMDRRIVAVSVRPALALAIAQINGLDLLSREKARESMASMLMRARASDVMSEGIEDPFTFERLKERLGWKDVGKPRDEQADGPGATGAAIGPPPAQAPSKPLSGT